MQNNILYFLLTTPIILIIHCLLSTILNRLTGSKTAYKVMGVLPATFLALKFVGFFFSRKKSTVYSDLVHINHPANVFGP